MKSRQDKEPTVQYECSCGNHDINEFTLIPQTGVQFVSCDECGRLYRVNPQGQKAVKTPIIEWLPPIKEE